MKSKRTVVCLSWNTWNTEANIVSKDCYNVSEPLVEKTKKVFMDDTNGKLDP